MPGGPLEKAKGAAELTLPSVFLNSKQLSKPGIGARELPIAHGPHSTPSATLACSALDPLLMA